MKRHCLLLALAFGSGACSTSEKICDERIFFSQDAERIEFEENEKLLACGDPTKQSWKEIPLSQSEYHLKTFLETRAFYEPRFEYRDKVLLVDPGKPLVATSVDFEGQPPGFEDVRIRKILDEPLNPKLLNYVESATIQRLKDMGYACPSAKATAVKETGAIHVKMESGPNFNFGIPITDGMGLYGEAMRRFDAFHPGDPFRYEWLKLTENRAESDGIVVSSQFTYPCTQAGPSLDLHQKLIPGEKRLLSLGGGASTEEFPIFQTTWKNVRTDENGSSLLINLYGSHRTQRIKGTYFWHMFKNSPRFHLDSTLRYERKRESTYRSSELEASFPAVYQWDFRSDSLQSSIGPAVKRNFSDDANLTKAVTLLSLIADITWFTHHFELYMGDPQMGSSMDLNLEFLREVNLRMLGTIIKFTGTHLIRLNPVYPTQWVFGIRYGLSTTFTNDGETGANVIPAQYLQTLGGDQNVRGFGRNELNGNGIGARSSAFGSLELRYAKTFPIGLEPFGFFDVGALGMQSMRLEPSFYYSPGVGIRWQTPFGAIRSTVAHGYVRPNPTPKLEHFQFFVSFGREF